MNLVVIPPGTSPEPHYHKDFETAIYILQGEVETRYGEGLKETMINRKGDFVFIPPGVPHQPYNLSKTEPAMAIVSRNDANEQENVVLYNPRSDGEYRNDRRWNLRRWAAQGLRTHRTERSETRRREPTIRPGLARRSCAVAVKPTAAAEPQEPEPQV